MTRVLIAAAALAGLALAGAGTLVWAAPPASHPASGQGALAAQAQQVDAKIEGARTRHAALQAQVSQLEQQNAAQQKQLQQRDAEIAALQQRLQAAGTPAPAASSAGH